MIKAFKWLKEISPKRYMSVAELKAKAKELNLHGYSKLTKPQLEELLAKALVVEMPVEVKIKVEGEDKTARSMEEPMKAKGKSSWNTFLSEYRKENGVSLKEAMKAKDKYPEWKLKAK